MAVVRVLRAQLTVLGAPGIGSEGGRGDEAGGEAVVVPVVAEEA
jgi:hypothetical protein